MTCFDEMCEVARSSGGRVELHRRDDEWGLHVTVAHENVPNEWRAIGIVFNDLRELEAHAEVALLWAVRSATKAR